MQMEMLKPRVLKLAFTTVHSTLCYLHSSAVSNHMRSFLINADPNLKVVFSDPCLSGMTLGP